MNIQEDYSPIIIGQNRKTLRTQHLLELDQNGDEQRQDDFYSQPNDNEQFQNQDQEDLSSDNWSEDDNDRRQQDQKSTNRIFSKKNKKNIKYKSKGISQEIGEGETKNLNKYYIKHVVKEIRMILQNEETEAKLKQLLDGNYNCNQLGRILDEEIFRRVAIKYIQSFNFFNDLLRSKKQINVQPIIQYAKKLEEISYKNKIFNYKD
ncbi:unnamed protein product [Paramecium octaurelia]|uniref:Uncharacterized protein n=1 Tax=Paramecium octaurelia TaxID=43137 RepID=A0A8S1WPM9_PAROT|nr:unnamed protein product [Paramecium octaurelia]